MKKPRIEQLDIHDASKKKEKSGFLFGLLFGLVPHAGCIAFLFFAVLGVTTATVFLKPLMLSSSFFYILVAISFLFATLSAALYLRRLGLFSILGIKRKRKYLSLLYGTTISVNLFLFLVVFPMAADLNPNNKGVGSEEATEPLSMTLRVAIPCSGHAPLITDELYGLGGVVKVDFVSPDVFVVTYDGNIVPGEKILALEVFKTYRAVVIKSQ